MTAADFAQFATMVGAVLSALLLIAIAFISPLITHHIKVSEFRQNWINEQRKDVADYLEASQAWIELFETSLKKGGATESDRKTLFDLRRKALTVFWRIKMRINPDENSFKERDQRFLDALYALIAEPNQAQMTGGTAYLNERWLPAADSSASQAQRLFKDEWEVTKLSLPASLYRRYTIWRKKTDARIQASQG